MVFTDHKSSCLLDNFLSEIKHCDDIEWIVNTPSGTNTTTDQPHCICFQFLICKGNDIASHTFSGLTELRIHSYNRMKKSFPRDILKDLGNLEVLHLCDEMKEMIATEEAEGSTHILMLPKVKELYL